MLHHMSLSLLLTLVLCLSEYVVADGAAAQIVNPGIPNHPNVIHETNTQLVGVPGVPTPSEHELKVKNITCAEGTGIKDSSSQKFITCVPCRSDDETCKTNGPKVTVDQLKAAAPIGGDKSHDESQIKTETFQNGAIPAIPGECVTHISGDFGKVCSPGKLTNSASPPLPQTPAVGTPEALKRLNDAQNLLKQNGDQEDEKAKPVLEGLPGVPEFPGANVNPFLKTERDDNTTASGSDTDAKSVPGLHVNLPSAPSDINTKFPGVHATLVGPAITNIPDAGVGSVVNITGAPCINNTKPGTPCNHAPKSTSSSSSETTVTSSTSQDNQQQHKGDSGAAGRSIDGGKQNPTTIPQSPKSSDSNSNSGRSSRSTNNPNKEKVKENNNNNKPTTKKSDGSFISLPTPLLLLLLLFI